MSQRIRLNFNGAELYNKVSCIKAVRSLTGIGLKEAKDLVEGSFQGGLDITRESYGIYSFDSRNVNTDEISVLRREGVTVTDATVLGTDMASLLKQAAIIAINAGDVNKAIGILSLV